MPFVKGQKEKIGRPKGVSNKSTRLIRDAFIKVFQDRGGHKGLAEWAEGNPDEFYKLASKLCPREMEVSGPDGGPIQTSVEVALVAAGQKNKG
jgi:hypothetical protein